MLQQTSFFLPLLVLIERKKKEEKKQKRIDNSRNFFEVKTRNYNRMAFPSVCKFFENRTFRQRPSKNTRLYELSYFRYCQLLLPQSSSPNNNNFPSVLMAHCLLRKGRHPFFLKFLKFFKKIILVYVIYSTAQLN